MILCVHVLIYERLFLGLSWCHCVVSVILLRETVSTRHRSTSSHGAGTVIVLFEMEEEHTHKHKQDTPMTLMRLLNL